MTDWHLIPHPGKWDYRFLGMARLVAQWSKDPSTKCGAIITQGRRVVSQGFNGFAANTPDDKELYMDKDYKMEMVIHSEENAILQAKTDLTDHTIYITAAPCGHCAAVIAQTGIQRVVIPSKEEDPFSYRGDGSSWSASLDRAETHLRSAGVALMVLKPSGFDPITLMGPEHPHKLHAPTHPFGMP